MTFYVAETHLLARQESPRFVHFLQVEFSIQLTWVNQYELKFFKKNIFQLWLVEHFIQGTNDKLP